MAMVVDLIFENLVDINVRFKGYNNAVIKLCTYI